MGTNYYLHRPKCSHCGVEPEPLHIGKSSAGWVFSLHVDPDHGIRDLDDWVELWNHDSATIYDEYGKKVAPLDMLITILCRTGYVGKAIKDAHWLMENQAVSGPFGLARGRDSEPGFGTYAKCRGEFS